MSSETPPEKDRETAMTSQQHKHSALCCNHGYCSCGRDCPLDKKDG